MIGRNLLINSGVGSIIRLGNNTLFRAAARGPCSGQHKKPSDLFASSWYASCRRFSSNASNNSGSIVDKFWRWTSQVRPDWKSNPVEGVVAVIIFGVTGTTAMSMIRPTINSALGIEGSLIEGPNSYRVFSLLFLSPFYALTLFVVGTAFGRHAYFAKMTKKILGRFLPSKIKEKIQCPHIAASKSSTYPS